MGEQERLQKRADFETSVRLRSPGSAEFADRNTANVCEAGLFVHSDEPLKRNTLLKLILEIDGEPVKAVGRVVWSRRPAHARAGRPAGVGIKFVKIDEASRERIAKLVGAIGGAEASTFERGPGSIPPEPPEASGEAPVISKSSSEVHRSDSPEKTGAAATEPEDRVSEVASDAGKAHSIPDELDEDSSEARANVHDMANRESNDEAPGDADEDPASDGEYEAREDDNSVSDDEDDRDEDDQDEDDQDEDDQDEDDQDEDDRDEDDQDEDDRDEVDQDEHDRDDQNEDGSELEDGIHDARSAEGGGTPGEANRKKGSRRRSKRQRKQAARDRRRRRRQEQRASVGVREATEEREDRRAGTTSNRRPNDPVKAKKAPERIANTTAATKSSAARRTNTDEDAAEIPEYRLGAMFWPLVVILLAVVGITVWYMFLRE